MTDVGVIGLGHMGSRVAATLLDAGDDVVVWDRRREAARELESRGARLAETPQELVARVDLALSALADDEAVREVVLDGGLLTALRDGAVFADLSTTSVELAVELGAAGREAGVDVLDVELSGSTPQVEQGSLALLVGGDADVLERVRPTLEPLAQTILHMGGHGAGSKTKLAVNTLLGVGMQALAEAIALGESLGLDRAALLDGLGQLAVVAPAHRPKLENAKRDAYPVAFALRLMDKDFGLILDHAEEHGLDLPATVASARVCAAELSAAREDVDFSAVIRQMERQIGSPARP
jgi:3-hydroxyisobutyrate dehydrogenase-like beta-hydroxyacid dehydrogenase